MTIEKEEEEEVEVDLSKEIWRGEAVIVSNERRDGVVGWKPFYPPTIINSYQDSDNKKKKSQNQNQNKKKQKGGKKRSKKKKTEKEEEEEYDDGGVDCEVYRVSSAITSLPSPHDPYNRQPKRAWHFSSPLATFPLSHKNTYFYPFHKGVLSLDTSIEEDKVGDENENEEEEERRVVLWRFGVSQDVRQQWEESGKNIPEVWENMILNMI